MGSHDEVLNLKTMLFYGIGQQTEGIKNTAFAVFLLFFYQQVIGLSGTLTGIALALALCVDAVTDPVAGYLSDRHHSKLGRRHPFFAGSALPLTVSFVLLFSPPAYLGEYATFAWLLFFATTVRVSLSFFHVPHLAFGTEMSKDLVTRSRLFTFGAFFRTISTGGVPIVGYLFFFPTTPQHDPGLLNDAGYFPFALFFAAWMLLGIAITYLGTMSAIPANKASNKESGPVWAKSFKQVLNGYLEILHALTNKAFRTAFTYFFTVALVAAVSGVFSPFMAFHFWELKTENMAVIVILSGPALFISIFAVPWLTARYDKRNILMASSLALVVLNTYAVLLRLMDVSWFPTNDSPVILALVLINSFLNAAITPVVIAIGDSMMADISNEIELETGDRREGVIFSSRAFMTKATGSLGLLIGGYGLDLISFPQNASTGSVHPDTVWQLGMVTGPITGALLVLSLFLIMGYPINRDRYNEIKQGLSR